MATRFRTYLELTKPRIVLLLMFTTVTAMVIAAEGVPRLGILLPSIIGGILAASGSSAINQVIDRDMDSRMTRTARRPIPSGRMLARNAFIFGVALVILSVIILGVWVNWLTAFLALGGAVYYVVLYTLILKRNTAANIIIGGGAGAIPALVGWAAVTNSLSLEAFLLFGIIFYWTPPHSWALALLVNSDYARANVPMMPVAYGERTTRRQILIYSILLVILTLTPGAANMLGLIYTVAAVILGVGLLRMSLRLIRHADRASAKRMYKYTTAYLAYLFLAMMIDQIVVI